MRVGGRVAVTLILNHCNDSTRVEKSNYLINQASIVPRHVCFVFVFVFGT